MSGKILITPRSFGQHKDKAYPLIIGRGYDIIENPFGRTMSAEEIVQLARRETVGIIVGLDPLPAGVLERCADLRAISKYGTGVDNIDIRKAEQLGIRVMSAQGANHASVAELAIGLLFSLARHIPQHSDSVRKGRWERIIGSEIAGKQLGIAGGGRIGKETALRARGIGMRVSIYDPYLSDDDFILESGIRREGDPWNLLGESDYISLHLPLTPETRGFIGGRELEAMKNSAYLINTARGELVDEAALYDALAGRRIAGAASDVLVSEPPGQNERLLSLDNFLLTPHVGAYTREAVERMVMLSTNNLLGMLDDNTQIAGMEICTR